MSGQSAGHTRPAAFPCSPMIPICRWRLRQLSTLWSSMRRVFMSLAPAFLEPPAWLPVTMRTSRGVRPLIPWM